MIATYWLTEVGQHMPVDIGILRKSGQIEKLPATCSNVDRSPKAIRARAVTLVRIKLPPYERTYYVRRYKNPVAD